MTRPRKHGKAWTKTDIRQIGVLAREGLDTDVIARRLGRTKPAVYSKASEEGISVKPKDPPNRR